MQPNGCMSTPAAQLPKSRSNRRCDGRQELNSTRRLSHGANLPTVCSLGWLNRRGSVTSSVADTRPYATLLAKGEDRKLRILDVAERLLARHGWRNTSLAQIAKEAGVSPAGLLHHFESKEQLLNSVLDARDTDDDIHADYQSGDLITEIKRVPKRFERAPELVGTFTVLLVENIAPDAPLHDRLHKRYRAAIDILTGNI